MRINQIARHLVRGQPYTSHLRLIITPGVKAVNTTPQGKKSSGSTQELGRSNIFVHKRRMS